MESTCFEMVHSSPNKAKTGVRQSQLRYIYTTHKRIQMRQMLMQRVLQAGTWPRVRRCVLQ